MYPQFLPFPHTAHATGHQTLSPLPQERPVLTAPTTSSAAMLCSQHPVTWMTACPLPGLPPLPSTLCALHSGQSAFLKCRSAQSSAHSPPGLPSSPGVPTKPSPRALLPLPHPCLSPTSPQLHHPSTSYLSLRNAYCRLTEHTLRGHCPLSLSRRQAPRGGTVSLVHCCIWHFVE